MKLKLIGHVASSGIITATIHSSWSSLFNTYLCQSSSWAKLALLVGPLAYWFMAIKGGNNVRFTGKNLIFGMLNDWVGILREKRNSKVSPAYQRKQSPAEIVSQSSGNSGSNVSHAPSGLTKSGVSHTSISRWDGFAEITAINSAF